MIEKINIPDTLKQYATDVGMAVMTMATVVGMLELPSHTVSKVALPFQTVTVTSNNYDELNNPIRREKEETGPEYVSYSESQRTPGRSGRY